MELIILGLVFCAAFALVILLLVLLMPRNLRRRTPAFKSPSAIARLKKQRKTIEALIDRMEDM